MPHLLEDPSSPGWNSNINGIELVRANTWKVEDFPGESRGPGGLQVLDAIAGFIAKLNDHINVPKIN